MAENPALAFLQQVLTATQTDVEQAALQNLLYTRLRTSGSRISSTGVVSLNLPLQDAFNVTNPAFGAKGDGVTDDTAAFILASAAQAAQGWGAIYAPYGRYLLNTYTSVRGTPMAFMLGSNVSFEGDGAATELIGGGASTTSGGTIGLYLVGNFPYDSATSYPITAATRGAFTVTLSTHGNAANFARGDIALLKTGVGLDGMTQNVVESASASTGVVVFRYALPKDFASSPTIANVTSVTGSNIHVRNMRIVASRQTFIGQQIVNLSFRDLVLEVADASVINHFQLNHICGGKFRDNDISWTAPTAVDGLGAGRSSSHIQVLDNRLASNGGVVSFGEGSSDGRVAGNTFFVNDTVGEPAISLGSAYGALITDNTGYFSTTTNSVPAIFEANGGVSHDVVIKDNRLKVTGTGNFAIQAGSPGTRVDDNTIESSVGGIWLTEANQTAIDNTITLTVGVGYEAILLEATTHTHTIANNRLTNTGTTGGNGIHVVDGGVQVQGPSITGNTVTNFTNGVLIGNAGNETGIVNANNQVV